MRKVQVKRRILPNGHKQGYTVSIDGDVVGIVFLGYYQTWTAQCFSRKIKTLGATRKQAVDRLVDEITSR